MHKNRLMVTRGGQCMCSGTPDTSQARVRQESGRGQAGVRHHVLQRLKRVSSTTSQTPQTQVRQASCRVRQQSGSSQARVGQESGKSQAPIGQKSGMSQAGVTQELSSRSQAQLGQASRRSQACVPGTTSHDTPGARDTSQARAKHE